MHGAAGSQRENDGNSYRQLLFLFLLLLYFFFSSSSSSFSPSSFSFFSFFFFLILVHLGFVLRFPLLLRFPRSGELRMQKLKSSLMRTQSLNVLPFKPGVGHYIAMHATLTARDFLLAYLYPSGSFTYIFSKTSPHFSCVSSGLHRILCRPAE